MSGKEADHFISLGVVTGETNIEINSYGGRPAPVVAGKQGVGDSMGPRPAPKPQPPEPKGK